MACRNDPFIPTFLSKFKKQPSFSFTATCAGKMDTFSLYNVCLQKVASFLYEGMFDTRQIDNPFKCFPSTIIRDLMSVMMHRQQPNGFRADRFEGVMNVITHSELKIQGLEPLLTSGKLPELKIHGMTVLFNLGRVLELLASACQNLEFLTLTFNRQYGNGVPELLEKLFSSAHNLKKIECEIEFDLNALKNCKNLQSIELMFTPTQPWYDFLQDEDGRLQALHSLKEFLVKNEMGLTNWEFTDYIVTILKYCPELLSLGCLDSTRALAVLHQSGMLPFVKLRHCFWSDWESIMYGNGDTDLYPETFRDAVMYHSSVENLDILIESIESIGYLSNLRNLVFLDIGIFVDSDISKQINMVFKDIGDKLRFLSLSFRKVPDIGELFQNCINLEALSFSATECPERFETDIKLPKLQYLSFEIKEKESQVLPLFTDCHNLTELFLSCKGGLDDKTLSLFLKRNNSLSNLKIAYSEYFGLTELGFKKFLLNAPNLQDIVTQDIAERMLINSALCKTNHTANSDASDICIYDEFFKKKNSKYMNYCES